MQRAPQPSCFDRVKVGFMIGFAIGMSSAALSGTYSSFNFGTKTWNCLPSQVCNLPKLAFKKSIRKALFTALEEKQFSLVDSIQKFKSLLAGIGVENCALNGGLECFDVNQAKLITDYFTDSLFQHYKLYQFLFTQKPQEEVVISELEVEVPPLASIPFPPPLDEGMTEEMWREHVMTPPQSPQPEEQKEGEMDQAGEEALSDNLAHVKDQAAENILSSLEPTQVKDILRKVADEVLGNLQAEVEAQLKERETVLAAKIGKLQPR